MSTTYVTKLDGAEVPVYSAGKVVMTLRGKKIGPNTYEGSVAGPGGTGTSKTTLSADGKTMTVDGMMGSNRVAPGLRPREIVFSTRPCAGTVESSPRCAALADTPASRCYHWRTT